MLVLLGLVVSVGKESTCMLLGSTGVLLHVLRGKGIHLLLVLLLVVVVVEATSTLHLIHVLSGTKRLVTTTSNVQGSNINSLVVGLVG